MNDDRFDWWNSLRHGGLLLDRPRLESLVPYDRPPLSDFEHDRFRRKLAQFQEDRSRHRADFIGYVLETIAGFSSGTGTWSRGSEVKSEWSRLALTGQPVKPRHIWVGANRATLPVFIDDSPRLGVGRGQRVFSQSLHWLRQGKEQLAIITNGQEWRLLFAGLDYEAFCEWDIDLWLTEGTVSPELTGFRALVNPSLWTPPKLDDPARLLAAINESRQGQSDLSQVLGERVRLAVEMLVRGHGSALNQLAGEVSSEEIYRAGVRIIMRMVVILFAESREGLLPRDNPVFHSSYSLQGLRELLERTAPHRLKQNYAAWPRVLSMFRLIHEGSSHEALTVPTYGGELFAPGDSKSDGMARALHVFENSCFEADLMNDADVKEILLLLTRTKVKIRQGRSSIWATMPVDFSSLDSEYIGILYEGLLDFELRTAPADQPIVFLAVGNQPALPLATLEAMSDTAIKNLLEKMKDTSGDDDEEDESEADDSEEETDGDDEEEAEEVEEVEDRSEAAADGEPTDIRHTTRARAEAWGRRACAVGGLVTKPRGRMTSEKQLQYDAALDAKARQVIPRVVLPGEWYLVRWGGTRKGSGTFYTRPQLAVPTVHRTLRPLAYDSPTEGITDAPIEQWIPKLPEVILNLKICDPACGSGTFPLAALRFLTEALYRSLQHHGRIREHAGRAVLSLINKGEGRLRQLSEEALPCRPEDEQFEQMTRAILRRYVVERCIYGVDLDPLAVELCRLSLWIATLDRRLPFTFLDHKIKPGNALVGAWFDQFLHYPAMAFAREGGDKNHTNGVHFKKEVRTKVIKEFFKKVRDDLKQFIDGGRLPFAVDLSYVQTAHDAAETALQEIHELGIEKANERAERYATLRGRAEFQKLKAAFDLWCALWFWPADELARAPLPSEFAEGKIDESARRISEQISRDQLFFHWELEFPDVFNVNSQGFDAILGNPPWDIAKPNSKEFFSTVDPLYRSYGKQEAANRYQPSYFTNDQSVELRWLDYRANFKAMSNWVKFAGFPFGDRVREDEKGNQKHDLNLGDRGKKSFESSARRHARWKFKREGSTGYADGEHSFRHQGAADVNLYKLFLEQAHALLSDGGRMGFIVPSGLYSDFGTGALRRLFIDQCQWEWLFGFENREGIFDIHRSFKFNPVIVTKGGETQAIRTAFMRRNLADWEHGEALAVLISREQTKTFSPETRVFLEVQSSREVEILETMFSTGVMLGSPSLTIEFTQPFDMTTDSALFPPLPKWQAQGFSCDEYGVWHSGKVIGLPVYEGRMIGQFDPFKKGWVSGKGRTAIWREIPWREKRIEPQYLMLASDFERECTWFPGVYALAYMKISSSTNTRSFIGTVIDRLPAVYSICFIVGEELTLPRWLALSGSLNSYTFDFAIRRRLGGLNITGFVLRELPVAILGNCLVDLIACIVAKLSLPNSRFAPAWLRLRPALPHKLAKFTLKGHWALTDHERLRAASMCEAIFAHAYGINLDQMQWILRECDYPTSSHSAGLPKTLFDPKGFWRVDKDKHPEHRHTVLSLVAFHDLQTQIKSSGGDVAKGIEAFCNQNDGEGWMLPETLRLADYGLGHDERAKQHQPVRECFGPRFYDWQLAQSAEESWNECHLHARNLLGAQGYTMLLDEIAGRPKKSHGRVGNSSVETKTKNGRSANARTLFDPPVE